MKVNFFRQEWRAFSRSPSLTQNLLQTMVMGLFGLYLAISLFVLGLVGGGLLAKHYPEIETVNAGGTVLMYYFLVDLVTRYFLQKFPTLAIKSYVLLPIRKSQLIHFLLRRSLLNGFNFLPLSFLVPFFFAAIWAKTSMINTLGFIVLAIGLTFLSHFLSFAFAKAGNFKKTYLLLILAAIFSILYLEYKGVISLFVPVSHIAQTIISNPVFWIIPIGLPVFAYTLLYRWFLRYLTVDKLADAGVASFGNQLDFSWFNRFGGPGKLMNLELRLMLRSKRARAYLLFSLVFLLLPLYADPGQEPLMLLIYGILMTGMIALNHGQLMLSWNSMHFDLLISRGNTISNLFTAKYYFLVFACVISFLLTLPYIFLNPQLVLYSGAALMINCSSSIFAYMLLASVNSLRVDPNEGGAFSMSGFGAAHYLIGLPIIGVPLAVFFIGYLLGGSDGGLVAILLVGATGMFFHKMLITYSVKLFERNRYKIAAAFRKKG